MVGHLRGLDLATDEKPTAGINHQDAGACLFLLHSPLHPWPNTAVKTSLMRGSTAVRAVKNSKVIMQCRAAKIFQQRGFSKERKSLLTK